MAQRDDEHGVESVSAALDWEDAGGGDVVRTRRVKLIHSHYPGIVNEEFTRYSNALMEALLEFGERLDLVLWETCHIYATCQAYRAEADFQQDHVVQMVSVCHKQGRQQAKRRNKYCNPAPKIPNPIGDAATTKKML